MGDRASADDGFSLVLIDGERSREIVPLDARRQEGRSRGDSVTVEATQRAAMRVAKQQSKQGMEVSEFAPTCAEEAERGTTAQEQSPETSANEERRGEFDGR